MLIIFVVLVTITEADCRPKTLFMQVDRPLYEETYAYRNGGLFDLRPLHMFFVIKGRM
jgi:hypothetical protein